MNPFNPQPSARPDAQNLATDPQLPPAMDTQNPAVQGQMQGQNAQGQTPNQPAQGQPMTNMAAPNQAPAPTASLSGNNGPTIGNTGVDLASPILGPTHFDNIKAPEQGFGSATPLAQEATSDAKKAKTYLVLSIVLGALAFIGIIVGIWSLVANVNTNNQLASAESALNVADAIITKIEDETGKTIRTAEDVPEYEAITGYVYVSEWGIKFKIPEDLENLSYILDQKYRPQICFTGNKTGIRYFPAFADIDQNRDGLGCVTRVALHEGDSDQDTGASFGQKVFTYDDYNYFYTGPAGHFSGDAAEQGLEDTAVQIIKNMIANNISHFE